MFMRSIPFPGWPFVPWQRARPATRPSRGEDGTCRCRSGDRGRELRPRPEGRGSDVRPGPPFCSAVSRRKPRSSSSRSSACPSVSGDPYVLRRRDVELDDLPPPRTPTTSIAGMDEQPVKPPLEAVSVAHGADVDPGCDQGILYRVQRLVVGSQDQPCGPIQVLVELSDQRSEGVVVTGGGSKDKISMHGRPARRGRFGRSRNHESAADEVVPSGVQRPGLVSTDAFADPSETDLACLADCRSPKQRHDLLWL